MAGGRVVHFRRRWGERGLSHWAERVEVQGAAEALREMLWAFALFTARRPELHRLLSFEGQADSERLDWLIETYIRPLYQFSTAAIQAAQKAGMASAGDPGRLHYAVIGVITDGYRFFEGISPHDGSRSVLAGRSREGCGTGLPRTRVAPCK